MNNKKILFLLILLIAISFMIGFSYAYFTPITIGNDEASNDTVTSGTLNLSYDGNDRIQFSKAEPGEYRDATFTVENIGTLPVNGYDIFLSLLNNEFINDEMVMSLTCSSSDANPCSNLSERPVPYESGKIHTGSSIAPNTIHTYTLRLKFLEKGIFQDYNQEKRVSFKVTIDKMLYGRGIMRATTGLDDDYAFYSVRDRITNIAIYDACNNITNCGVYIDNNIIFTSAGWNYLDDGYSTAIIEMWDVSADQDESVIAYIVPDELNPGYYNLGIVTSWNFSFNPNSSYLFANFTSLSNFYSKYEFYIEDTSYMFYNCTSLEIVANDVKNGIGYIDYDTISMYDVVNTTSMFENCYSLDNIYFNITTGNLTNFQNMFLNIPSNITVNAYSVNLWDFFSSNKTTLKITGSILYFGKVSE